MLQWKNVYQARIAVAIWLLIATLPGCQRLRIPQIDPTGNRIFLPAPNTTTILTPGLVARENRDPRPNFPVQPAFTFPTQPDACCAPKAATSNGRQYIIPKSRRYPTRGQLGEIIMTPSKIIAPVGSEVVVLAGICGNDSHFVMNQPLEWLLSADSVGQFIEVGGQNHPTFNRLVPPSAKKFDGNYAWGRTGLKNVLLTRGTPTPVDDIELRKGQAFVSLSSESPGTSYVTCVAPKAQAWDKRRKATTIHWVDASWCIPVPKTATAGTVTPLTTIVSRTTDSGGVEGWKVKYEIVGGAAAEFAPNGSQSVETVTDSNGQATVQLRQVAGQFDPGTTQIRVDVVRPRIFGQPELVVESGITSVTWSAPALTIRAIGPKVAGINQAFNYRVEVSNPGDQITRGAVLRSKDFPESLEFVSSTPKPTVFGRQLEWQLGDIQPGEQPKVVDIQLKSNTRGGNELCFEVSSESDQLKTEACAQTEISVPCIGLKIDGPNAAKVGEQAKFNIVVSNQCDDPLENIELQIQYDAGLQATGLGNPIKSNIGSLEPGQERTIPIVFDVVSAGRHCYNLSVTADGGHTARANECVEAEPTSTNSVQLQLEGQRRVDRNDNVLIRGSVTNNGNIPLTSVTLTNRFSSSLEPSRVTQEYPHRWLGPAGDELIFDLGRLDPGQSKVVEIFYQALQEDGNAFSEMTISSPDVSPITQKYDLRIEIPGTVGPGDDGGESGQSDPSDSSSQPREPEGTIGIPDDNQSQQLNSQRDLTITAEFRDNQIAIGTQARVDFVIRNQSTIADTNVSMTLLVPSGLVLADIVDDLGNQYGVEERSADFTEFILTPRREMRPGDEIKLTAIVGGNRVGQAFIELQATSDNSAGTITASDSITISQ